ncbi:MAG: hypothetical protein DRO39_01960 [Thermoprotei archaeon]|nr:MAG: hypothetical protein DRO39_01960 [Thermoprotei archaeon]
MVILYMCRGCKRIIHAWARPREGELSPPTPSEVIKRFKGRCPYCGRQLQRPRLEDVTIRYPHNDFPAEKGRVVVKVL